MKNIGFIGLGNMGAPMAGHLVKAGYVVRGYDVSSTARNAAHDAGVTVVTSLEEAVAGAEAVITMLPKGDHVRSVLLGESGMLSRLPAGTLLIDSSSIDVNTTREIHSLANQRELKVLDAPVSGGVGGASAGTLTFMVGGSQESAIAARPLFEVMGGQIFHVGGAGTGQAVKACNQMVFGSSLVALAEAFVLAEQAGISAKSLFDVLRTSSGDCWALHNFCPRPGLVEGSAADDDYSPKFAAALLAKDLGLATDTARETGVELVVGAGAKTKVSELALDQGHLDSSAVIKTIKVKTEAYN